MPGSQVVPGSGAYNPLGAAPGQARGLQGTAFLQRLYAGPEVGAHRPPGFRGVLLLDSAFTTAVATAAIGPSSGVVFVAITTNLATGTPATVSSITPDTGLSGTFTEIVAGGVLESANRRLSLWVGTGVIGNGGIIVNLSAGGQSSTRVQVVELVGIDPNNPYVASNIVTNTSNGVAVTNLDITPGALAKPDNAILAFVQHNGTGKVTPEDGAEEIYDSHPTIGVGIESAFLTNWSAGAMGGVFASSVAAVIGVEVQFTPAAGGTAALATPATVAAVASVPAPTVLAAAIATPASVAAVATVGAPTVQAAAQATPSTVAATATVGAPTVAAAAITTPATVAAVATVPSPSVLAAAVVTPTTVAAVASVPAPSVVIGVAPTPGTVSAIADVGAPVILAAAIAVAGTVNAVASVPNPASPLFYSGYGGGYGSPSFPVAPVSTVIAIVSIPSAVLVGPSVRGTVRGWDSPVGVALASSGRISWVDGVDTRVAVARASARRISRASSHDASLTKATGSAS